MEVPGWIRQELAECNQLMRPEEMQECILSGERIDDLLRDGYQIIQNPERFCFGIDAVLLSDFVPAGGRGEKVLDLGTGNGILPILLWAKKKGQRFTGLEIQPEIADMANRSVLINGLRQQIEIVCGDMKEASGLFGNASFDMVVSNPPYMKSKGAIINQDDGKAIARHELKMELEDLIRETAAVLKVRGYFYMIHRPNRLTEILYLMHQYRLEPQRIRFVHPFVDKAATMVMVEGRKDCQAFLKVEEPLILYDRDTGERLTHGN